MLRDKFEVDQKFVIQCMDYVTLTVVIMSRRRQLDLIGNIEGCTYVYGDVYNRAGRLIQGLTPLSYK